MGIFDGNELRFVLRCSGSVIPKGLIWAIPSAVLATVLHRFLESAGVKHNLVEQDGQIWSTFYYVLGVLLVFRTNQAYSRYWEGATLLQQVRGEWFNAISSLFAFCSKDRKDRLKVERFQHLLVRLMSMLYCTALQKIALIPPEKFETISTLGIDPNSLAVLANADEQCEVLVHWIQRHVIEGYNSGVVGVPAPILSRVFQELSRGLVNAQNVRKIAEVPFPFPYTQMCVIMLLASSVLTPLLASITSSTSWEAGFLAFMPTLTFWCLNYMAAEIEQPFGEDANDLPIPEMVRTMNNSLRRLVNPETQVTPGFDFDPRMHYGCPLESWADHGSRAYEAMQAARADPRFSSEFSKKRRTKPNTSVVPSPTRMPMPPILQRSNTRSTTAPPAVSPPPSAPQSPTESTSPAPPNGPAELLQLSLQRDDSGYAGRSRSQTTAEAVAEAIALTRSSRSLRSPRHMQPPDPLVTVRPPDPLRLAHTAWDDEDDLEDQIALRPKRNLCKQETLDRPPGWLLNDVDDEPHDRNVPMGGANTSVVVSVVPSQVGDLRLGPKSPARRHITP
eukprot:CAMPEP_0171222200 /NCGR_PEP_ID=MMETSP0790-20130122/35142_1 /TAXON_ID=2925 /ORGANISM="Alexandrium catenella, Strain OF101" /LENGTH=560 /DNA_ID=CAMNT_0011688141 /DNA_START=85 /DNA_END=1767 /DNA_ORIENTATION=-